MNWFGQWFDVRLHPDVFKTLLNNPTRFDVAVHEPGTETGSCAKVAAWIVP